MCRELASKYLVRLLFCLPLTRAVNAWIREYAERHALAFCDTRAAVAAAGAPDRLASSPDDLHPSPEGYRLMALAIEPAIKRALEKAQPLR